VANHFPSLPAMVVANLQYIVHMTPVANGTSSTPQQSVQLVNFGFEVPDGQGGITFDYSRFDQDVYETQLKTMLNGICAQWAGNLGTDVPTVQAAMSIQRQWTFNGSPGYQQSDSLPYP
jgi:hypothetical protein